MSNRIFKCLYPQRELLKKCSKKQNCQATGPLAIGQRKKKMALMLGDRQASSLGRDGHRVASLF